MTLTQCGAAIVVLSACHGACSSLNLKYGGDACARGVPTAAERAYLQNPAAIAVRLRQLERRVGPRVGGLSLNKWGDLTVSTSKSDRVGIGYAGARESGYRGLGDPGWSSHGAALSFSDIHPQVLVSLIKRTARRVPKQHFQDAMILFDTGRPTWQIEYLPTLFVAYPDGSGLCASYTPDNCPQSISPSVPYEG
jgi:hypothetical protein